MIITIGGFNDTRIYKKRQIYKENYPFSNDKCKGRNGNSEKSLSGSDCGQSSYSNREKKARCKKEGLYPSFLRI